MTSVHPRQDARILHKQCRSLLKIANEVSLIVADGLGDQNAAGIAIHDVGAPHSRVGRIWHTIRKIYSKALGLDADIYHFHDPELCAVGLLLKRHGYKVIYDVHEDYPLKVYQKHYLPRNCRGLLSAAVRIAERWCSSRFDSIVAATPEIGKFMQVANPRTVTVKNYPVVEEFLSQVEKKWEEREEAVVYAGGLMKEKGIDKCVQALEICHSAARMHLAGKFVNQNFKQGLEQTPGWKKVEFHGYLDRKRLGRLYGKCRIGIVTLQPIPSYVVSLPVKMFEYMAAGLPVIASDFPLWKEIVEAKHAGICVNPADPSEIADAIDHLLKNPITAEGMGRNGRRAVLEEYSWASQEKVLIESYRKCIS
ncbi:glycosyltransferase family 4 protein [Desulfoferrobacter suflitae]|uniref:glycosyltransferase family 4 protein n=1 Tax=Desulfoferrobacter suflitae TaxID=2865782 RepID=UPI002164D6E7|nr:glycosyltransferase family 4 protein [Desulfoferrobacter suflitae]MCK8604361.1 glycosyltransferase family 4 protein [Desulfoferrobacter suflitae]